jgi:hypothetical protein
MSLSTTPASAPKRDPFPRLPADAIPTNSGRQVYVFPSGDRKWSIFETNNSGRGSEFEHDTKGDCIAEALRYVYRENAELVICNNPYGEFASSDLAEMFRPDTAPAKPEEPKPLPQPLPAHKKYFEIFVIEYETREAWFVFHIARESCGYLLDRGTKAECLALAMSIAERESILLHVSKRG